MLRLECWGQLSSWHSVSFVWTFLILSTHFDTYLISQISHISTLFFFQGNWIPLIPLASWQGYAGQPFFNLLIDSDEKATRAAYDKLGQATFLWFISCHNNAKAEAALLERLPEMHRIAAVYMLAGISGALPLPSQFSQFNAAPICFPGCRPSWNLTTLLLLFSKRLGRLGPLDLECL